MLDKNEKEVQMLRPYPTKIIIGKNSFDILVEEMLSRIC